MYTVTTQQIIREPTIDFTICPNAYIDNTGIPEYTAELMKELDQIKIDPVTFKWNLGVAIRLSTAKPMRVVAPLAVITSILSQIEAQPTKFTKLAELFNGVLNETGV